MADVKLVDLPSVPVVYKAIRNYLVNELHVDKATIEETVKGLVERAIADWLRRQLEMKRSWLRDLIEKELVRQVERHLSRNLSVAIGKAELKAEVVMVDNRMNEDTP